MFTLSPDLGVAGVSVDEVYAAMAAQDTLKLARMVMVGDRGMITYARIAAQGPG